MLPKLDETVLAIDRQPVRRPLPRVEPTRRLQLREARGHRPRSVPVRPKGEVELVRLDLDAQLLAPGYAGPHGDGEHLGSARLDGDQTASDETERDGSRGVVLILESSLHVAE